MSVQQFCLRWNNHQPNFISVCSSLLHNGTLVDVTLAAEGRQLQAHKIVLSACSSYFQALFTTNPCQHPIVILKDVQYDDLKTMVDFMYYGEVNVSQEQLPHILKTAEMLKIKGLAEMPTDPANLTKSDSKSSTDGTELVGGSGVGTGAGTSSGSLGAASGSSVGDSLWSSSEAQQFQQQQQQQQAQQQAQQQHHHHQQQQQALQQQQQQAQQQQQQQHHHHHHQQQQSGQAQAAQTHHHQMRRTPSPLSAGTSPATRRKRLRKSSNNGSGDRNNAEEQHNSSLDVGSGAGNAGLSLAQMSQMSFGAGGGLAGHSLHAAKLLKESAGAELEQQPQDSDLDDGHGHLHMQIKPEVDIGGVNQTMPLDISGGTTPSEHDAPNSQSSHSEPSPAHAPHPPHPPLAAASSSSGGSGSFERSFSIGGAGSVDCDPDGTPSSPVVMGTKRNRVLTRQPRVKRDSDSISSTNQISPDTAATTLDFDPFNAAGATSVTARDYSTTGSHHLHHQPPVHHHHHLLTVPPRIERHASEPAPSLGPSTPHLLSVPSSTPYLIKQHSDPLLPRQSALHIVGGSGSSSGMTTVSNPFAPLHRQYSHPLSGTSASYVSPAPLHHPHHISLPESIYASGSPPPAGSSQYLVPTRVVACPVVSSETAATPTNASPGSSSALSAAVSVVTSPTSGLQNSATRHPLSPTFSVGSDVANERRSPHSPNTNIRSQVVERAGKNQGEAANGGSRLRNSKSASGSISGTHLHPGQVTMSSSFEHLPTLRVKNEELQRSVSSPQTQREIITLENPRSSHCPVIRPGPALGCNFCWNTIDGHGRILRRKTKYHCPECETNLCIVPCFQEYHERLNNEAAAAGVGSSSGENQMNSSSTTGSGSSSSGKASPYVSSAGSSSSGAGAARHYTKTESI